MEYQDRQTFNFEVFYATSIEPAYSLYTTGTTIASSRARSMAEGCLLEALGWVSLGALLGHFGASAPARLSEGIDVFVKAGFARFFESWEYLLDPDWALLLSPTSRSRRLPELPSVGDEVAHAFEASLASSIQLSRNPAATAAVAIFDFDQGYDIEDYLNVKATMEDVAEAMASESGIDKNTGTIAMGAMYGGFGELMNFLEQFRELRLYLANDDASKELFRKVARLLRWRFHFLEQQNPLYHQFVSRYLDILGVEDAESRVQFQTHLKALTTDWREMQGPAQVTQTAGA
jgi:hypothetical protein